MTSTAIETGTELLTPRQAAAFLTMSLSFLYKRAAAGKIPTIRVGRSLRFRRCDLAAWIQMQSRGDC
jgi:excisionase family DNA binding protein